MMKEQQKSKQQALSTVIIKTMSQGIKQPTANCNKAKRSEENSEQDEEEQLGAQPAAGGGKGEQPRGELRREQQRARERDGG